MGSSLSTIVSPETVLVAIVTGATVYVLTSNSGIPPVLEHWKLSATTDQPSSNATTGSPTKPAKPTKKKKAQLTAKNSGSLAPSPSSSPSVHHHHDTPASSPRQKGKSVASLAPDAVVAHGGIPGGFDVALASVINPVPNAGAGAATSDYNVTTANKGKQKNKSKNKNKKEKEKEKSTTKSTSPNTRPGASGPHASDSYAGDAPAVRTASGTPSGADGNAVAEDGQGGAAGQRPRSHPSTSLSSVDMDGSWTRVETHRQKESKSKALPSEDGTPMLAVSTDVTTSDDVGTSTISPVTGRSTDDDDEHVVTHETQTGTEEDSDGSTHHRRTFAEKRLLKPIKTGVQDMLERPDVPTLARVMRVQPRAGETPAPGFTWDDYEDVDQGSPNIHDADEEDQGEWDVVKGKSRTRNSRTTLASASISISTTSTSTPSVAQAPESMSKKQRQNAKKRELLKAAKAETEAARLAGLAKHKRELERQRIIELSQQGGGKRPSGGMQASVDHRGKLIWE